MYNSTTPFVAFTMNSQTNTYQVFLVNPTRTPYVRVVTLTGAFMTMDDDLVETSKAVKERGELLPMSALEIESGDVDDLEFSVWYHLDLYEQGAGDPVHSWFSLPGAMSALFGYKPESLPVISAGQLIEMFPCPQRSIQEEIKTLVMESQYHKHGGQSIPNHFEQAQKLVIERIGGFRKGTTDIPNWIHSVHVQSALQRHGFSDEVVMAGLLHDIVEDGNTSLDDLRSMGFSSRVIALVDLCSHDQTVVGSEARWITMMARLIDAHDQDAWAIKIADITDNLRSCHTMPEDKQRFMRQVKGEIMLRLTKPLLGMHPLWQELQEQVDA